MNEDLKRCYEILDLNESATLEDALLSYKRLINDRTSWDDVKEITWAFDLIKEHFKSIENDTSGASVTPESVQHSPAFEGTDRYSKKLRKRFLLSILLIFIIFIVILIYSRQFNVLDYIFPKKEMDISTLIRSVKPAIVTIGTGGNSRGSGFVVSKDGFIATNAHVMREKTGKAAFFDGTVVNVELVLLDPDRDFALLKARESIEYTPLHLGDSSSCSEGETVIAAGTPLSFETSFTRGIISSSRRSFPAYKASFIQTDAALSPGNSGGPLINMRGEVIGINSLKITGKNVEGIGFAVSINDVKHYILGKNRMSDEELSKEIAKVDAKMEEMNSWRDGASGNAEKSLKDKRIEEQWEYERKKREFYNKVDEANRNLKEQRDKEETRLREEAERYRRQMREQMEARRKALSDCLQNANYNYQRSWDDACRSIGQPSRCRLPYSGANILEQRLVQQRNECFRLYPQ